MIMLKHFAIKENKNFTKHDENDENDENSKKLYLCNF